MSDIKSDNCPYCKEVIEVSSPVDGESLPKENDLCMCIHCTEWSYYGEDMKLNKFTEEEYNLLNPDLKEEMEVLSQRLKLSKISRN